MQRDLIKTLTAAGLIALACVPALKHMGGAVLNRPSGSVSQAENRRLALTPRWQGSVREYADGMDRYLNDNFGLRGTGLRINTALRRMVGDGAYSVVRGQDGWLFLGDGPMRQSFAGRGLITPQILTGWHDKTQKINHAAQAFNAPFVITLVPDKLRIYPEHAPRQYGAPARRRLRQLLLEQTSRALPGQTVDIEPELLAAKPSGLVYAKTDTHWTGRGAYAAYRALMEGLNAQTDAPWPLLPQSALSETEIKNKDTDLRQILGDETMAKESYSDRQLPQTAPHPEVTVTPAGTGAQIHGTLVLERPPQAGKIDGERAPQTLVIIGDSFADIAAPFFTHSFSRVVRLHHLEGTIDPGTINAYQPDAVILMPVERSIAGWHFPRP